MRVREKELAAESKRLGLACWSWRSKNIRIRRIRIQIRIRNTDWKYRSSRNHVTQTLQMFVCCSSALAWRRGHAGRRPCGHHQCRHVRRRSQVPMWHKLKDGQSKMLICLLGGTIDLREILKWLLNLWQKKSFFAKPHGYASFWKQEAGTRFATE